jgi:D-alanyl-D-alanine carboxypeptidase
MLSDKVESWKLPGAVIYIATSDGDWSAVNGTADLSAQTPLQPTDRFRTGGLSELFISVICLQLVEEGTLDLNDPIANWLPAAVSQRISNSKKITIKQLLNHTSGLPDPYDKAFQQAVNADPTHVWQPQEVLSYLADRPTTALDQFSFSNANYVLLGMIVERATGSSLATAIRNRVSDRLSLKNTFLEVEEKIPGGFVQGYQDWNEDGTTESVTKPLLNTALGLGDAGIISSAPDLAKFFRGLFISNTLLYPRSLDTMLAPVDTDEGGYGLGIARIPTAWGEAWGQMSKTTGFSSVILYLPVHDLIVVVWTNSGDQETEAVYEIARRSLRIILGVP